MKYPSHTLYAKDQLGGIRVWSITADEDEIIINHGKLGMTMSESFETVDEGLASRTLYEQVVSRINSRVSKKLDMGYVYDIEVARNRLKVNAEGHEMPMLAKKYKDVAGKIDLSRGKWFTQPKYNGNRCLIKNVNGTIISYSRKGKINNRLDHILDKVDIPNGMILDGELYRHGTPLQTLNSWIKKSSPETKSLKFICYDTNLPGNYEERFARVDEFIDFSNDIIIKCPTIQVYSHEEVSSALGLHMRNGYEGAMLRKNEYEYQSGMRSNSLLKVKKFEDDEYEVIDVLPSSDGWGILICKTGLGNTFRVSAPGTIAQKTEILRNKKSYIGRKINVEYLELTLSGVPSHPVAIYFRDDV